MDETLMLLKIQASELYTAVLQYSLRLSNIPDSVSLNTRNEIYDEINTLVTNYDSIVRAISSVNPDVTISVLDPLCLRELINIEQMAHVRWNIQRNPRSYMNNSNSNGIHTPPRLTGGRKKKTRRAKKW